MLTPHDPRVQKMEEELTRVRRELERTLDGIPAEKWHAAPEGAWTPAQILWHVAKVERGVARMIEKQVAALPEMSTIPPGPGTAQVVHLLDHIPFLDRSRKLRAPEPLRPPPDVDVAAERARLAEGRRQLIEACNYAGPRLSLVRHDHPFFGPFDGWQWVMQVARHEERHHLQLREVLGIP